MQNLHSEKTKKILISALSLLLALSSLILLSPQNVAAVPVTGLYATTDALNLREGPGTSYTVVNGTTIPRNCSIIIDDFSDDYQWGHTSYNGNTGWVYMAYTVKIDDNATHVGKTGDQIIAEITSTYSRMRANRGSSYSGWCGQYVKDMLNYLNIGFYGKGSYNGNQWYYTLITDGITSYGYKQVKYPGASCLYDILEANGGVAYNIVISFKAFYSSNGSYVPYGHVLFINAIINNTVYYSESFSMRRGQEGAPQVYSLDNFINYYYDYFGDPIGAIHMTQGTTLKPVSGTKIENVASAKNLTLEEKNESSDFEGAATSLYSSLGASDRQVFHFEPTGTEGVFTIRPESSETRVLSVSSNTISGSSLVLSEYQNKASQEWYFHIIDKNNYRYVIRSKADPDYVLTANGTSDGSSIILSKYAAGNTKQIWKIPTGQNLSCKVQEMSLSSTTLEIATDTTAKLTVNLFPAFAANGTYTWSSDDPSIVSVQGGTIVGKAKGTTLIRATLSDGSLYAVCTVTVKDELTLLGDANKDNIVSLLDFNIVTRYVNHDITAADINVENADINRDGVIDNKDLEEYVKYFSGNTNCILYKEHGSPQ